jgi:hypothetical protein
MQQRRLNSGIRHTLSESFVIMYCLFKVNYVLLDK